MSLKEAKESGELWNPRVIREYRQEIKERTGKTVPRRIGELGDWIDRHKASLSGQLNDSFEDDEETETESDNE